MKLFVTGGAGYIGAATAQALIDAGHEVLVFDNLSKGYRSAVPEGAQFVRGSLADPTSLAAAISAYQPDAIAHFAAYIEAGESMQDPGKYFDNNVTNSLNLLRVMVDHDIQRLVFSSTAGVYASKVTPIREDDPIAPANAYAETKLMIERMLHWYHQVHNLKAVALRYFNACGALVAGDDALHGEAHQPETHLIPLTLQVALGQREKLYVFGSDYPTPDGTCIRDYVHIADLASAHVLALNAIDELGFAVYNLGNGRGYSIREVVDTTRRVTGHPIPTEDAPRRPGDAPALVASSEKIKEELRWQPRYPALETIIRTAWLWHRTHPHGYRSLKQTP